MKKIFFLAGFFLSIMGVQAQKVVNFSQENLTNTNVTAALNAQKIGTNEQWIAHLNNSVIILQDIRHTEGVVVGTFDSYGDARCANLIKVTGAAKVTAINDAAFYRCKSLTSVSFPVVKTIGSRAFERCEILNLVSFPVAETIEDKAFSYCKSLTSVSFPAAKTIGSRAFEGCEILNSVSFPVTKTIGNNAFGDCLSLNSLSFPIAETIGESAFYNCWNLTSVSFPAVETVGDDAFESCISLTSVSFPVAETIGNRTFLGLRLASVSFPTVKKIGDFAFMGCTGLTSLSLGTELTEETDIEFGLDVFYSVSTDNIDFTLGAKVDVSGTDTNISNNKYNGYTFKSITIDGNTGISNVLANGRNITGYYNITGVKLQNEPASGFYIITYSNGTAEKVLKK